MSGIKSSAMEPTAHDLRGLGPVGRMVRLLPTYGLVLLTLGLGILFSILLPDTFPTMLNLRSNVSDKSIIALLSLAPMIPLVTRNIHLTV
eukprot:gene42177-52368_t